MNEKSIQLPNPAQRAKGRYKVQVVRDGRVVQDLPWRDNLILNRGLETTLTSGVLWCDRFARCAPGVGTTPTSDDSGAITAYYDAGDSNSVKSSAGFFPTVNTADSCLSTPVGRMIVWDNGSYATITALDTNQRILIDPASIVGTPPSAAPGTEFTIYRVNQDNLDTGLNSWSTGATGNPVRSTGFLSDWPNTGTQISSNESPAYITMDMRRTFEFPANTSGAPIIINELGMTHSTSSPSSVSGLLFSRMVLAGGVSIGVGEQLRVVYQLLVTVTPIRTASVAAPTMTLPFTGRADLDLSYGITQYSGTSLADNIGIGVVSTTGGNTTSSSTLPEVHVNCPGNTTAGAFTLSTASHAVPVLGASKSTIPDAGRATLSASNFTYGSATKLDTGDYYRDGSYLFGTSSANGTAFQSFSLGATTSFPNASYSFYAVFTTTLTKADTHTLSFTRRWIVGRVF